MQREASTPSHRARLRRFYDSNAADALMWAVIAVGAVVLAVTEATHRVAFGAAAGASAALAAWSWFHGTPGWLYTFTNLVYGKNERKRNRRSRR